MLPANGDPWTPQQQRQVQAERDRVSPPAGQPWGRPWGPGSDAAPAPASPPAPQSSPGYWGPPAGQDGSGPGGAPEAGRPGEG
ncbi:hypothetical protein FM076_14440, partial [Streptomyces albus subsp. chlorinus]|nr:hypothetical protein [Streptomyces albus subsp. chlorinus]